MSSFKVSTFISAYAVSHFMVDAACAFLFWGTQGFNENMLLSYLVYNALAFVLQAPLGLLIDRGFNPKLASISGLLIIALSFLFRSQLYLVLSMIGIGNALFHVGGGSQVLSLEKWKATYAGVFVAPGAVGLAFGSYLAVSTYKISLILFPLILVIAALVIFFVTSPKAEYVVSREPKTNLLVLFIAMIMLVIVVRSSIGLSMRLPWKENQIFLIIFMAAVASGKIFGGFLADKFGLLRVGVGALLIAAPLLAFFSSIPALGITGVFIVNFTMPVTLIAILKFIPKNKGLTFGLTTVALFIGSLPKLLGDYDWIHNNWVVFLLTITVAIVLLLSLLFQNKLKLSKS